MRQFDCAAMLKAEEGEELREGSKTEILDRKQEHLLGVLPRKFQQGFRRCRELFFFSIRARVEPALRLLLLVPAIAYHPLRIGEGFVQKVEHRSRVVADLLEAVHSVLRAVVPRVQEDPPLRQAVDLLGPVVEVVVLAPRLTILHVMGRGGLVKEGAEHLELAVVLSAEVHPGQPVDHVENRRRAGAPAGRQDDEESPSPEIAA
mmetsp:Transcript_68486/g.189522  ORF Transcript_68486/g.189522 Transcript_68486/m.189522 type:complete len:204 (-) Transcript_68486:257-868(-)